VPWRAIFLAVLSAAITLTPAACQAGAEVRIGSGLLSQPDSAGVCSAACTAGNLFLPSSKAAFQGVLSPVNGTVASWLYRSGDSPESPISLRILHPNGGLSFTGAGTSSSVPVFGGIRGQFGTALPIRIGDAIGIDSNGAQIVSTGIAGATQVSWTLPPLADGGTRDATIGTDVETMVQAIIAPTNTVSFGAVQRNRRKGTASIRVQVPNAGTLSYAGVGITGTGPASVNAPGGIQIFVKVRGKKRDRLRKRGSAWVSPQVTFLPVQGDAGTTIDKLKLVKKL
jgi:hypothetical protein